MPISESCTIIHMCNSIVDWEVLLISRSQYCKIFVEGEEDKYSCTCIKNIRPLTWGSWNSRTSFGYAHVYKVYTYSDVLTVRWSTDVCEGQFTTDVSGMLLSSSLLSAAAVVSRQSCPPPEDCTASVCLGMQSPCNG